MGVQKLSEGVDKFFLDEGGGIEIFSEEFHGGVETFLGVEIFWKGWNFFGGVEKFSGGDVENFQSKLKFLAKMNCSK